MSTRYIRVTEFKSFVMSDKRFSMRKSDHFYGPFLRVPMVHPFICPLLPV